MREWHIDTEIIGELKMSIEKKHMRSGSFVNSLSMERANRLARIPSNGRYQESDEIQKVIDENKGEGVGSDFLYYALNLDDVNIDHMICAVLIISKQLS